MLNVQIVTRYRSITILCAGTATFKFSGNNRPLPVYMTNIACLGVERRLVDCRRGQLATNCNTRVGANCTECKILHVYGVYQPLS